MEKPRTKEFFSIRKDSSDGFTNCCRDCKNKYHREWKSKNKDRLDEKYSESRKSYLQQYHIDNKEKHNKRSREDYQKNKEHYNKLSKIDYERKRDYYSANRRKNYQINRKRELESKRKYYQKNKKRINLYNKKYARNNPEIMRASYNRRRSRIKNLPSTLTSSEWDFCVSFFEHKCAYCGSDSPLQQEHFIAAYHGGGYTKCNIIPSCQSCNNNKRTRMFDDWYHEKEFYCKDRENKIIRYIAKMRKENDNSGKYQYRIG